MVHYLCKINFSSFERCVFDMFPYDEQDNRIENTDAPVSQPDTAVPSAEPTVTPETSAISEAPEVPAAPEVPIVNEWTASVTEVQPEEEATATPVSPTTPPSPPAWQPPTPYQYTAGQPYNPYGWRPPEQPIAPAKAKKRNTSAIMLAVLATVCAVTLAALAGLTIWSQQSHGNGGQSGHSGSSQNGGTVLPGDADTLDIIETEDDADILNTQSIIKKNLNCTVVITTYEEISAYDPFQLGYGYSNSTGGLIEASNATGIVWSEDGYIITNRHCVINENTNIQYAQIDVKTYDGTVYEKAEIIGVDSDTDLAVIKVNANNLTPAEFGDSSALELGDKVVALGNAGGLEWTPTQGIISGLARDVYDETGYEIKCLQTDAAINPGNSGGPLINAQGQVIGINSAKIVASGHESLGFSIPIIEAKGVLESLRNYGYVKGRVAIGIDGTTYTSTNTNYNGFQITSIYKTSSLINTAAEAGDIITHVDDVRVTDYASLRAQLSTHKVGDTVTLTLLHVNNRRQIETITVSCTLMESTGE